MHADMAIMAKQPGFPIINVMLVGNRGIGKESLKIRYFFEYFPEVVPGCYHICQDLRMFKEILYYLDVFEVNGDEEYDGLRPLIYEKVTENAVAVMCYSVIDVNSLNRLKSKLIEEVRQYFGQSVPMILLGLKSDLTAKTDRDVEREPLFLRKMCQHLASETGISKLLICSALTGEGVTNIFEEAVRVSDLFRKDSRKKIEKANRCNLI